MKKTERFSTYKHNFVYGNNLLITRQFIVLRHSDGTLTFTNFHKYAKNPNRKVKKFSENGNNRFTFINKSLKNNIIDTTTKVRPITKSGSTVIEGLFDL